MQFHIVFPRLLVYVLVIIALCDEKCAAKRIKFRLLPCFLFISRFSHVNCNECCVFVCLRLSTMHSHACNMSFADDGRVGHTHTHTRIFNAFLLTLQWIRVKIKHSWLVYSINPMKRLQKPFCPSNGMLHFYSIEIHSILQITLLLWHNEISMNVWNCTDLSQYFNNSIISSERDTREPSEVGSALDVYNLKYIYWEFCCCFLDEMTAVHPFCTAKSAPNFEKRRRK